MENNISKFVVGAIAIIVFIFLFAGLVEMGGKNDRGPGILGTILFVGLIGALRAIFKKK